MEFEHKIENEKLINKAVYLYHAPYHSPIEIYLIVKAMNYELKPRKKPITEENYNEVYPYFIKKVTGENVACRRPDNTMTLMNIAVDTFRDTSIFSRINAAAKVFKVFRD